MEAPKSPLALISVWNSLTCFDQRKNIHQQNDQHDVLKASMSTVADKKYRRKRFAI
jgi:hypothetical protein